VYNIICKCKNLPERALKSVDIDPGVIGSCGFCDGVFATDVDVLEDVETIGLNCFALGAENNETNA
jgi:hypothetical protein